MLIYWRRYPNSILAPLVCVLTSILLGVGAAFCVNGVRLLLHIEWMGIAESLIGAALVSLYFLIQHRVGKMAMQKSGK